MIDFAKITVKAGSGGRGAGTFTHIKGKRYGKADGGDGGDGGSAYFEASADLNTLEPFRFIKDYKAEGGGGGLSRRRKGARGADLIIKVPVGTQTSIITGSVSRNLTPLDHSFSRDQRSDANLHKGQVGWNSKIAPSRATSLRINEFAYDLVKAGQKVLIARGGEGGRGNLKLRDEFGRRPRSGEEGKEGEVFNLILELKLIADVGLIGLPNAGKSTLLGAITSAKPKVASYPFTTLEPNLGVLTFSGPASQSAFTPGHSFSRDQRSDANFHKGQVGWNSQIASSRAASRRHIVLADIPGLIEGASKGKGLGDLFLRHIDRTKMLVHLIDIAGKSQDQVWQDYQIVRSELKAYSKNLIKKREIIVLNKIDLVGRDLAFEISKMFKNKRKRVLAVSALSGKGLEELVEAVGKIAV